jgi:hypothetical protein
MTKKKVLKRIIISQKFKGAAHAGIDFYPDSGGSGAMVRAPVGLRITQVGFMPGSIASGIKGYGNYIYAIDRYGNQFRFGHFQEPTKLKAGQKITAGTVVGLLGTTGYSTGPHVHLEIRNKQGVAINPEIYLKENKFGLESFFVRVPGSPESADIEIPKTASMRSKMDEVVNNSLMNTSSVKSVPAKKTNSGTKFNPKSETGQDIPGNILAGVYSALAGNGKVAAGISTATTILPERIKKK